MFLRSDWLFCFNSLCKFGSFKNPELYFKFRKEIYAVATKEKIDFYELWQQHKQVKTMAMSEAWPDTYNEEYIHQFQPEPSHKIQKQQ